MISSSLQLPPECVPSCIGEGCQWRVLGDRAIGDTHGVFAGCELENGVSRGGHWQRRRSLLCLQAIQSKVEMRNEDGGESVAREVSGAIAHIIGSSDVRVREQYNQGECVFVERKDDLHRVQTQEHAGNARKFHTKQDMQSKHDIPKIYDALSQHQFRKRRA